MPTSIISAISSMYLLITIVLLVLGFLSGFIKGFPKAIIRIITVIISAIIAYSLCDKVYDFFMEININGQPVESYINQMIREIASGSNQALTAQLTDLAFILVRSIYSALMFMSIFMILYFVTKIIYWIIAAIMSPLTKHAPKLRILGGLVGLLQGALIAACICVPSAGLGNEAAKVLSNETVQGYISEAFTKDELEFITSSSENGMGKFYVSIGESFFKDITTVKTDKGEKTLSDTVDAALALFESLDSIASSSNASDTVTNIAETIEKIDNLPPAAKEIVVETIVDAVGAIVNDYGIDIGNLNITTSSNFKSESEALTIVAQYIDNPENVSPSNAVETLLKTDIALPLLASLDVQVELTPNQKAEVEKTISKLSNTYSQEKIDMVKDIFNL